METLKKLTRAEMKNVKGGEVWNCGCKDACKTYDDCPGQQDCLSATCMGSSPGCNYKECGGKI